MNANNLKLDMAPVNLPMYGASASKNIGFAWMNPKYGETLGNFDWQKDELKHELDYASAAGYLNSTKVFPSRTEAFKYLNLNEKKNM